MAACSSSITAAFPLSHTAATREDTWADPEVGIGRCTVSACPACRMLRRSISMPGIVSDAGVRSPAEMPSPATMANVGRTCRSRS